jgi:uncharacterized protein YprB with RNaseH-like and TPR domain
MADVLVMTTNSSDKWSRIAALRPTRPAAAHPAQLRSPEPGSIAELLGAEIARNRFGEHLAVRRWFSTPELFESAPAALDLLSRARHDSQDRAARMALDDPSRWLFLDTETTGLAGGAGTYAFLVGIAWWDSGGLQVEQFFMRDYTDEHSILHELAARLAERSVLFTFNGKCFDWPLLETRFLMTRSIAPPRLAAHFDLLHPARAIWKLRLGSVRLVALERHVLDAPRLGWDRGDDVDSALIPQLYFDYLRGGPAHPLSGVLRHNQMDLRGLAALLGKITALLADADSRAEPPGSEDEALDLYGLARFLHRRGEHARARSACRSALDAGLPAEFRLVARCELARLAKRHGDFAQAAALWEELAADPRDGVAACEELAIHYERRVHDLRRALDYASLGLRKLRLLRTKPENTLLSGHFVRLEEKFLRRLARLELRVQNGTAALLPPPLARSARASGRVRGRIAT